MNGVRVGGVTDIQTSGVDVSFIDTTTHDTAGGFRTFVAGLKDGGTLEVTGKYDYSNAGQAEWKAEEGMRHQIVILMSDGSGMTFEAIIGGFQTSNPLDDAVEFTATGKITGDVIPVFPTMTVTGSLTTDGSTAIAFGAMVIVPTANILLWESPGDKGLKNVGAIWQLEDEVTDSRWESTSTALTPNLVPSGAWHETTNPDAWKPVAPATGTPIITAS